MSKRKQRTPQKTTEDKRQCMSWNMMDGVQSSGSLSIFADNDPALLQEIKESQASTSKANNYVKSQKDVDKPQVSNSRIQEELEANLKDVLYCVPVQKHFNVRNQEWHTAFAKFKVQLLPENSITAPPKDSLPQCKEFWLYFSDISGRSFIYFEPKENNENNPSLGEVKKDIVFWSMDSDVPWEVFEALHGYNTKHFQVTLDQYDSDQYVLWLTIHIREAILTHPKFPSEFVRLKRLNHQIQKLMSFFYGKAAPSYDISEGTKKHDIDALYKIVKSNHSQEEITLDIDVQHPSLIPQLRKYQRDGVRWMLHKERFNIKQENTEPEIHMMYEKVETPGGAVLYYNKFAGSLTLTPQMTVATPPGGILADEMGLGKTVEVLACMLAHKRDESEFYIAPLPPEKEERLCDFESESLTNDSSVSTISDSGTLVPSHSSVGMSNDSSIATSNDSSVVTTNDSLDPTSDSSVWKTDDSPANDSKDNHESFDNCSQTLSQEKNSMDDTTSTSKNLSCDTNVENLCAMQTTNVCSSESTELVSVETYACNNSGNIYQGETTALELQNQESSNFPKCKPAEKSIKEAVKEDDLEEDQSLNSLESDCINTKPQNKKKRTKRKGWTTAKKPRRQIARKKSEGGDEKSNIQSSEIVPQVLQPSPVSKKRKKHSKFVEFVEEDNFKAKNIFSISENTVRPREFFECICGEKNKRKSKNKRSIQCVKCGLWQHAVCVNYNVHDLYRGEFKCPHCHASSPPIPSGATLIISPSSICHQWVDEILKHIRSQSLQVFVYKGVNKQGYIQPSTLARQDIVITTYETLRKEIDYVDLPHSNSDSGRKFRHPKRFMATPSPITAVEWWRICLDEAQMVECTTTKTAEMALRLSAVNRWCVTGTPIQKSICDLYGLLLFLGVDPYFVRQWWNTLLYEPFCCGKQKPLYDLVTSVLWRTVKTDVIDQIDLPDQTEHVHWLTFSPVEDHFYRRQYQDCVSQARKNLSKWTDLSVKLSSLDRQTVNQLLHPLLKLRQACCHPQAVRGEFLPLQKTTMTMEELLESLTKKAKLECEESHRQLVAALNGLGGLCMIRDEYSVAVEHYREVLWSVEEHKNDLRTDDLQQLHAMYNLHEVLQLKPEGVAPTLRDSELQQQCEELKEKYLAKTAAKVSTCQEALLPTQQSLKEIYEQLLFGRDWWLEVMTFAEDRQLDYKLVDMVQTDLRKDSMGFSRGASRSIADLFANTGGLELVLQPRIEALKSAHKNLVAGIKKLSRPLTQDRINEAIECCLRPVNGVSNSCAYCEVNKLFQDYESKLFQTQLKEKTIFDEEGKSSTQTLTEGNWRDGEVEKSLKTILSFSKFHGVDRELIQYGTHHVKYFETIKKEFRNLRAVWIALYEQVQAIDELNMATTRLRLRLPDEEVPNSSQINVIDPSEMEQQKLKLLSDKTIGQNELRKKLGQLFYLKNLSKVKLEDDDGTNPEPCPICQRELGVEWSVLQCGHCFCLECIQIMVVQYSFGSRNRRLKCAMCRQASYQSDISYVSTKKSDMWAESSDFKARVKGSYSTKIEGVVACMLKIHRDDPQGKILIFSTWTSVLGIIDQALTENNITHKCLYTNGKFQENLSEFKEERDMTALLLPIHSGANGLNLTEAQYVILVEPVLNPAQELQAIGRVHRIGQKRSTQVHRFLIRGTIEQKMHSILKSIEDVSSSHNTEENVLTIGHLTALLQEQRNETDNQSAAEVDQPIGDSNTATHDDMYPITPHCSNTNPVNNSHSNAVVQPITDIDVTHGNNDQSHTDGDIQVIPNSDTNSSEQLVNDIVTNPITVETSSSNEIQPTADSVTYPVCNTQPIRNEVSTEVSSVESVTNILSLPEQHGQPNNDTVAPINPNVHSLDDIPVSTVESVQPITDMVISSDTDVQPMTDTVSFEQINQHYRDNNILVSSGTDIMQLNNDNASSHGLDQVIDANSEDRHPTDEHENASSHDLDQVIDTNSEDSHPIGEHDTTCESV